MQYQLISNATLIGTVELIIYEIRLNGLIKYEIDCLIGIIVCVNLTSFSKQPIFSKKNKENLTNIHS